MRAKRIGPARSQIRQRRTPQRQKQEPHHRARDMARRAWALPVARCMRPGSGHRRSGRSRSGHRRSGDCRYGRSKASAQPGYQRSQGTSRIPRGSVKEKRCADNTPILQARASMVESDFSSRGIQILRSVTGGKRRRFRPSDAPKHADASPQRASFSTSPSSITFTPNSFALSSFVPASAPATT